MRQIKADLEHPNLPYKSFLPLVQIENKHVKKLSGKL